MVKVKAKLWLEKDSAFVLGKGRAELLRKVGELGSLAKAAKSMRMSYSHAWSELKAISIALGGPVVEASSGGRRGGGSRLTARGEKILHRYEEERERLDRHLAKRNR